MKYFHKTTSITSLNTALILKSLLFLLIPAISSCVEIIPEGEMPRVSTTEASQVYYTTAVAEGTVDFPEHTKEIGVMFGSDKNDMSFVKGSESDGKISVQLKNLKEGTKYYYAAAARIGKKEIVGSIMDFTTFVNGPVDLGLPSGLKWASANLGAEYPTENGGYYAWGEVRTKQQYDWTTYLWCKGTYSSITKYFNQTRETTLESSDDAASVVLGGSWRMPTAGDWAELKENCAVRAIKVNGVNGLKVYNKKTMDESVFIFLPFSGYMQGVKLVLEYYDGLYWSNLLNKPSYISDALANSVSLDSGGIWQSESTRVLGLSIRPVCD